MNPRLIQMMLALGASHGAFLPDKRTTRRRSQKPGYDPEIAAKYRAEREARKAANYKKRYPNGKTP